MPEISTIVFTAFFSMTMLLMLILAYCSVADGGK